MPEIFVNYILVAAGAGFLSVFLGITLFYFIKKRSYQWLDSQLDAAYKEFQFNIQNIGKAQLTKTNAGIALLKLVREYDASFGEKSRYSPALKQRTPWISTLSFPNLIYPALGIYILLGILFSGYLIRVQQPVNSDPEISKTIREMNAIIRKDQETITGEQAQVKDLQQKNADLQAENANLQSKYADLRIRYVETLNNMYALITSQQQKILEEIRALQTLE